MILSRSRSFWVVTLIGFALLMVLSKGRDRKSIFLFVVCILAASATFLILKYRTETMLLASGTINRFSTLSTASTQDISLLNRFSEWRSLWAKIKLNPVLGYGWGVPFTHFSYISKSWFTWSYTHNGWLGLWYKNGLWGLGLMTWIWGAACINSLKLAWGPRGSNAVVGAGLAAVLIPYTIAVNTANPFVLKDLALAVTILLAIAHGTYQQATASRTGHAQPSGAATS